MKKSKRLLSLLLCLALVFSVLALGLTACGGKTEGTGPLNKSSVSVELGRTASVSLEESGVATWAIEDESIATVKSMVGGKMCTITGVKIGKTLLTATYGGGKTKTIPVTVTERNVLTVKANGQEVSSTDLERDKTLQLSVTSNIGSKKFKWSSSDPSIATVSNSGLVKGVFAGKANITVKVDGDDETYATVLVNVTPKAGTVEYKLLMGEEGGAKAWVEADDDYTGEEIKADTFFEWHTRGNWGQPITFEKSPQYSEGVISFKYTSDWNPGLWNGVQIFYKNSKHTVGNTYKLNCKINVKAASLTSAENSQDEPLESFFVTLNDNKIELHQGVNDVEVYYVYTAPLGQGGTSSFDLQMGWDDPSHTNGWFVQNADIEISDIGWTNDSPVTLETPTFTYANNKVTVTDPNNEGVGCYRAVFYKGETMVGASDFNNGEDFNTSALEKGEYTVAIQAVGKNAHYKDSAETDATASVTVTEDPSYRMTRKGGIDEALAKPGTWTYFNQWYVSVETAAHVKGTTTLKFSNNDGAYDTLLLYYKNPTNVANRNYKLTVDIELLGDDNGGMVTINGTELYLLPGKHTYEIGYTETSGGTSFVLMGAIYSQNTSGSHEITEGTINVSNYSWTQVTTPEILGTPTNAAVTVEENEAKVTFDANVQNANRYEIGFFKDGNAEPSLTKTTYLGEATVALDYLASGTYTVKVRAKGDGIAFRTDNAWSAPSASFEYENPNGNVYELADNNSTNASTVRGKWTFWTQWAVEKDTKNKLQPVCIGDEVKLSFENNQGDWYNLQLFIDPTECENGKTYEIKLTFDIQNALITDDGLTGGADYVPADHATDEKTFKITVADQVYELEAGVKKEYTFTVTNKQGPIQILFGINPDVNGNTYNHISAGDITISGLTVTQK